MADITFESMRVAIVRIVRAGIEFAERVFWILRDLFRAIADFALKVARLPPLTAPMSSFDRSRLFREPVRLHLPESQRPRRVGRSASLSSSWRLAAA